MSVRALRRMRVAVVGVGHLGRHHARILRALDEVDLVAVVDIRPERAVEVAQASDTTALNNYRELEGGVDAVTVAVPTESHAAVATWFLNRAIPVLVEKPIARSVTEADTMLDAASRSGTLLAVGHTERFNPAVTAASAVINNPLFVEVHRLGAFPDRSLDIDVVFDLMIHDLDVLLALVGSEVESVDAVGVPVLTERVDIANARLRFTSGCIANITASRISRERVRKLRIFQPDGYVSVDFAEQEAEIWQLVASGEPEDSCSNNAARVIPSVQGRKLAIEREEPLRLELLDFVNAARDGRTAAVQGEDGRKALVLAQRITDVISEHMRSLKSLRSSEPAGGFIPALSRDISGVSRP